MLVNLGENGTGGLLGAIGTALLAVPWMLSIFGPKIRKSSKFASVSCIFP